MKKIPIMTILFCVCVIIGLSSCSKDSEDLIVGRWKCTYDSENPSDIGFVWEFRSNGTMTTFDQEDMLYGNYVEYKIINDNTLSLLGGLINYTIDNLTKSKLDLSDNGRKIKFKKTSNSDTGSSNSSGDNNGGGSNGGGTGTSGGGHGGHGTGKSASNIGYWSATYASAAKAHNTMFYKGE